MKSNKYQCGHPFRVQWTRKGCPQLLFAITVCSNWQLFQSVHCTIQSAHRKLRWIHVSNKWRDKSAERGGHVVHNEARMHDSPPSIIANYLPRVFLPRINYRRGPVGRICAGHLLPARPGPVRRITRAGHCWIIDGVQCACAAREQAAATSGVRQTAQNYCRWCCFVQRASNSDIKQSFDINIYAATLWSRQLEVNDVSK